MTKPLRLSHSSASRFQDCGYSYKLHYVERLRSETKSAALFFGSAIDKALEAILSDPDQALRVFEETWSKQELNGELIDLRSSIQIVYANADYDSDLLSKDAIAYLSEVSGSEDPIEEVDKIYRQKEAIGFQLLSKEKKLLLNAANWWCLHAKGIAMLETLKREVLPNIEQVLATQKYVELVNESGDSVIGYADLVCKWKGIDEPVIFDLKTSARPYDEEAVLTSPQLALYVYGLYDEYKTHKAGYIVLSKSIRKNKTKVCKKCGNDGSGKNHKTCDAEVDKKRCHGEWIVTVNPEATVQILIDDVPEKVQEIVVDNMSYVSDSIKSGSFPRSFGSCIKPWGRCPYYGLCYKDDMTGLKKED